MKTSNFASRTQVKNPRCVPLGIPPFSGGIPSDPTWDYGTSCMGSHQLKLGSYHRFLIASHLGNHIPGRIKPKIPPIPPWDPASNFR